MIISEKVEWVPLGQYQKDPSIPPIPEYRVKLVADVYVPRAKLKPIGLQARFNGTVFRSGERAVLEVKAEREASIGIFNITADDRVLMLFPNDFERSNLASISNPLVPGKKFQCRAGHADSPGP